jgi:hypothetical protein
MFCNLLKLFERFLRRQPQPLIRFQNCSTLVTYLKIGVNKKGAPNGS